MSTSYHRDQPYIPFPTVITRQAPISPYMDLPKSSEWTTPNDISHIIREVGKLRIQGRSETVIETFRQGSIDVTVKSDMVRNISTCNSDVMSAIERNMYNIDNETFQQVGLNPDFKDLISCSMQTMTSVELREFINKLVLRSDLPGVNSTIYEGKTSEASRTYPFILKSGHHETLVHEAAVGLLCMNSLSRIVPNFMYTYLYKECSTPLVGVGKAGELQKVSDPKNSKLAKGNYAGNIVDTWCYDNKGKQVGYLVVGSIFNSCSVHDMMCSLSPNDFAEIYIQVLSACQIANETFGFTHYDLHANNVLIQRYSSPIKIQLWDGSYLVTSIIAYIIDFGMTRVQYDGYNMGIHVLRDIGIRHDSDFPAYDAYKFILGCGNVSRDGMNPYVHLLCDELYRQYGEGTIANRIQQYRLASRSKDFFHPSEHHRSLRYTDFIRYALDVFTRHGIRLNIQAEASTVPSAIAGSMTLAEYLAAHYPQHPPRDVKDLNRLAITHGISVLMNNSHILVNEVSAGIKNNTLWIGEVMTYCHDVERLLNRSMSDPNIDIYDILWKLARCSLSVENIREWCDLCEPLLDDISSVDSVMSGYIDGIEELRSNCSTLKDAMVRVLARIRAGYHTQILSQMSVKTYNELAAFVR